MTEQAGYMNQPDLIVECENRVNDAEMRFLAGCGSNGFHEMSSADVPDTLRVHAVLAVLRERGLLNSQGLELIKQSGEAK